MTNWNPSAHIAGMEVIPWGAAPVSSPNTVGQAVHFTSTVTETIDRVVIPSPTGSSSNVGRAGVDVYEYPNQNVRAGQSFTDLLPNGDVGGSGTGWEINPGGSTNNLYAAIASNPSSPSLTQSIIENSRQVGSSKHFSVKANTFSTSKRIVAVAVRMLHHGGSVRCSITGPGGATETLETGANFSGDRRVVKLSFGEVCPWTGQAWNQTEIRKFHDGTARIRIARGDRSAQLLVPQIWAMSLQVEMWDEHRVAHGMTSVSGSTTMITVPTVDEWEKEEGKQYVVVARAVTDRSDGATLSRVRTAYFSGETPPGFGIHGVAPLVLGTGGLRIAGGSFDPERIMAFVLRRTDTEFSTDGSEYYGVSNLGASVRQIIPVETTGAYGSISAVVKPPSSAGDVDPITLQIQTSGGSAVGAPVSITRADLPRVGRLVGNGWWHVRAPVDDPPTLNAGSTYRVQTASPSGWQVMVLGGSNDHGNAGYAGYEGYVDYFGQTGARDAAIALGIAPDPVDGLTVEVRGLPMNPTAPTGSCPSFGMMPYVRVHWSPSELSSADFGGYEVQRYDEVGSRWETIARLDSVGSSGIDDHEARFGVPTAYRVRVLREDGTPSRWSGDTGSSSVTLPKPETPGLWFTSSVEPELGLAYMDVYGAGRADRTFSLLDGTTTDYVQYFGRDYQVAHRPTEARGVAFQRRVLVNAESTVIPTFGVFSALRRLTTSNLAAICVRDAEGNRWWGWVDVPSVTLTIGDHAYGEIMFTETTAEPPPLRASNVTLGGGWQNVTGGFGADGDGAFVARVGRSGRAVAAVDTGHADGAIAVRLDDAAPASNSMGVAVRVVDADNYIYVRRRSFNQTYIGVVIGGAEKLTTGISLPLNFTITFEGSSSTGGLVVRLLDRGQQAGTATITDPVFDGVTRHGIFWYGPNLPAGRARWKEWTFYEPGRSLGGGWESWGGSTWRIVGGEAARYASGGDPASSVAVIDSGMADCRVRVPIGDVLDRTRIVFRAQDEDNFLYVRASATFNRWQLYKRIGGVETLIADLGGPARDDVVAEVFLYGDKFRARFEGGFTKMPGGDERTLVLPGDVAFLQTATHHGLGSDERHVDGGSPVRFRSVRIEPLRHWGVNGSALMSIPATPWIGRQVDVFQLDPPPLASDDAVALMWGVNDAISTSAELYADGIRTVIRRLNALASFSASVLGKTSGWTTVSSRGHNTGDSYIVANDPGEYLVVPANHLVEAAVCTFIALDGGGTAKISLTADGTNPIPGTESIMVDTDRGEWGFEPMFSVSVPLAGIPEEMFTVRVEVVSGPVAIDSVSYPSSAPPRIAVGNVARFLQGADFTASSATSTTVTHLGAQWTPGEHVGATARVYEGPGAIQDRTIVANTANTITVDSPWATIPVAGQSRIHVNQVGSPWGNITDRKIAEMNTAIAAVAGEFPNVTIVDVDDVMDRDPDLFSGDGIHPSKAGHDALGAAFAARIGAGSTWRSLWVFGHSYSTGQGGGPAGFDYHLARRLRFVQRVLDVFDREDDRGDVREAGWGS